MTTTSLLRQLGLTVLSLVLGFTSIPVAHAQVSSSKTTTVTAHDAPVLQYDRALKPIRTYKADMTAYTSAVEECDEDPFTAADGTTTYDGMVAANFLPFGTKVRIPELFGDKVFVVHDRMNKRYWYRMDVWMKEKSTARKFGLHRNVTIEIVEMGDGKTLYTKRAEAKRQELALKKLEAAKLKAELAAAKATK